MVDVWGWGVGGGGGGVFIRRGGLGAGGHLLLARPPRWTETPFKFPKSSVRTGAVVRNKVRHKLSHRQLSCLGVMHKKCFHSDVGMLGGPSRALDYRVSLAPTASPYPLLSDDLAPPPQPQVMPR